MRKIPKGPSLPSFVHSTDLKITVEEKNGKIIGFHVKNLKRKKEQFFGVVDDNILAAWKQVEKFTTDL